MAVPKRKKSKSKVRMRQRARKVSMPALSACPNCGQARQPHTACPSCGHYRGRQVLSIRTE